MQTLVWNNPIYPYSEKIKKKRKPASAHTPSLTHAPNLNKFLEAFHLKHSHKALWEMRFCNFLIYLASCLYCISQLPQNWPTVLSLEKARNVSQDTGRECKRVSQRKDTRSDTNAKAFHVLSGPSEDICVCTCIFTHALRVCISLYCMCVCVYAYVCFSMQAALD